MSERSIPQPPKRIGQPEEVPDALARLAGPQNTLAAGQMVFLDDGGEVLLRGETSGRGLSGPSSPLGEGLILAESIRRVKLRSDHACGVISSRVLGVPTVSDTGWTK